MSQISSLTPDLTEWFASIDDELNTWLQLFDDDGELLTVLCHHKISSIRVFVLVFPTMENFKSLIQERGSWGIAAQLFCDIQDGK